MAHANLGGFFKVKLAKAAEQKKDVDWKSRKAEWLKSIDGLYSKIKDELLAEPINDKSIKVSYLEKRIAEELLGIYVVKELVLNVGDEEVVFSPVGRNVVGASGRVDLRGDMGEVTLVLQPGGRWGIVASRVPTLRIVPLNESNLLDAFKQVMRP